MWLLFCSAAFAVQLINGLQFPAIGDWGDDVPSGIVTQRQTAERMAAWCAVNTCDFILDTGDNFYPEGVTSPTDPKFTDSWRNVYNQPSLINKNWYMSVGNRDYIDKRPSDGRELHQVTFGETEPRWILPHLWYDFIYRDPAGFSVHFLIIDSQALRWGANDADAQWAWLEETLATTTAEWKIVMSHHPAYACGNQGPTDATIEGQVLPILKRHKVQLLLSAHDHNFQHIQNATNILEIDYVISGGGGRGINNVDNGKVNELISRGLRVPYFGFHYGFTDLSFTADQLTVRFVNTDGTIPYQFTRGRSTNT